MPSIMPIARMAREFLDAHRNRLRNLAVASSSNGVTIAASVVALGFNTRGLGSAQFGVFVVIQSYVALWATVCTLESWQTVCRLGAEENAEIRRICMRTLVLDAGAAVVGCAAAIGGLIVAGTAAGIPQADIDLAIIYALSLLAGIAGTPKGYFRLLDRFDVIAVNHIWNAVLTVIASVLLWYFGAHLKHYIYVFALIGVVYRLHLLLHLLLALRKLGVGPRTAKQNLAFGRIFKMSLGVSFLSTLANNRKNIALLAVSGLLGNVAAGLFAAALKCTAPLTKAADLTNQVIFGDVVKSLRSPVVPPEKIARLRRLTVAMLFTLALVATLGAVLARPIVRLVLDDSFLGAAPVLAALIYVEAIQVAGIAFNPAFQARGATTLLSVIYAGSLALFLAAAIVLRESLTPTNAAVLLLITMAGAYLAQYLLVLGPRNLLSRKIEA